MELLSVIAALSRRLLAVILGAVLAVAAGAAASGAIGGPDDSKVAGQAIVRVMVDTPESTAVTTVTKGTDTIGLRAFMLADLMARDSARDVIARGANIGAGELAILGPSMAAPPIQGTLPELSTMAASELAAGQHEYVLNLRSDSAIPIVSIAASAPDARGAVRLADAAVDALQAMTVRQAGSSGVRIQPLGAARSVEVLARPNRRWIIGFVAALAVFVLWCAAIVVAAGVARFWRDADARALEAT
jgi:hypothetical protein